MKRILIGITFLLMTVLTFAQQGRTITGRVTDPAGELLPGVSIVEKGTTNGTITDIDGNYSVALSGDEATLVYS
ncbi:MAG: carboxypeptidase-like regulatory domain-containing protein, partial [Marinilabiliaceae bacterium]|nr:carboxypeptidase-like regulatory domain-containing protein [Marinilabiliaceae bacterium]